jgi:hypothetical protein
MTVAAKDVAVEDGSHFTNLSVNDEYTTDTLSEPRGRLLRAFVR